MPQTIRQRRKKQKQKAQQVNDASTSLSTAIRDREKDKKDNKQQKGIVKTLLYYVIVAVLLYVGRHASHYIILKRPHVVNSILPNLLRPAVDYHDSRQVLIVGTMSSGTSQAAVDLTEKLGLEIGHELTDALHHFVRDGTSSWFHGIRFFETTTNTEEQQRSSIIQNLCYNFTEKMGFHPRQYHAVPGCSEKKPWYPLSKCWLRDCLDVLDKEWGCAATTGGCIGAQPFQTTLHQVRDPRATVESLVAKFCRDNDKSSSASINGTMQADWIRFHNILFHGRGHDFDRYSCIEAASHYVMEYNNILSRARAKGWIAAMYKVETTTPCEIAKLAGFLNYKTAVYKPNYHKLQSKCSSSSGNAIARRPMSSTTNQINKGRIRFEWSDYEGGKHGSLRPKGDRSLEKSMRKLMLSLGYDPDEERPPQQQQQSAATTGGDMTAKKREVY